MTTSGPPPRWRVVVPRLAAPLALFMGLGYLLLGTIRDIYVMQFIGGALSVLSLVVGLIAVDMWRRERQWRRGR